MYLSDNDIRMYLDLFRFECRLEKHPFLPESQIGPASVDLRIDTVFWQVNKKTRRWGGLTLGLQGRRPETIDLRQQDIYEAQPALHWRRKDLAPGDTFVLRPGESIMGRTYEMFSIPPGMAGKLSSRVSYSRMGLLIHCGNDFMNPGWRGHQPLQLVNLSGLPIRIGPLFPVAQVSFVPLTSLSAKIYQNTDSYMNDDGGPSKWWRDTAVKRLIEDHGQDNLPRPVSDVINRYIRFGLFSDFQLQRLITFRDSARVDSYTDGHVFLEKFAFLEQQERTRRRFQKYAVTVIFPLLAVPIGNTIWESPYNIKSLALGFALILLIALWVQQVTTDIDDSDYFLPTDWNKRRRKDAVSTE